MRKKDIRRPVIKIILYIFISICAVASLSPLVWMAFNSLKTNEEIFSSNIYGFPLHPNYENYIHAVTQFNILSFFRNSLIVSAICVFCTIFLAMMFSYATARMHWRFSEAVRLYAIMGMFIPVQIIIIPLVMIIKNMHLNNNLLSIILPYIAFNLSFISMIFYANFRSIPFEMEESAAIDGANVYTTFFKIILPMVKPAVATAAILVFLNTWNELFIAMVLITKNNLKTLPLGLLYFQGEFSTDWGASSAALTIASLPPIILYLLFSKQFENALTVGSAVKG